MQYEDIKKDMTMKHNSSKFVWEISGLNL